MKITKKLKLIFVPILIVFFSAMMGILLLVTNTYLNITFGKGTDAYEMESFANPVITLNKSSGAVYTEICNKAVESPDSFLDNEYLNKLNEELGNNNSYIIVRTEDGILYEGAEDEYRVNETLLPEYGSNSQIEGGMFIDRPEAFYIRQQDFMTSEGMKGSVFIVSYAKDLLHNFRSICWQMLFATLGIFLIISGFLSWYMHWVFLRPLRLLQAGTERIKQGDLGQDVEVLAEDEIGEVCHSFNEMRSKLKESVDDQLRYEEENRELISNISHDLKTPITAIKGYVEGIMDGVADTPEKMERYIKTIYNKANEMNVLINELSIYTQIDNNAIPYNFTKLKVSEYFADCIEDIGIDLESKGIKLSYVNLCHSTTRVVADPEQLRRVIWNIVTNAVKYNDKAHGVIEIAINENQDTVEVHIKDNGKGIAQTDLPLVFDRMYRADSSRSSSTGGSGLGLAIAKKIIEEHGGNIWAESEEGIGTAITFTIKIYKEEKK